MLDIRVLRESIRSLNLREVGLPNLAKHPEYTQQMHCAHLGTLLVAMGQDRIMLTPR